MVKSPVTFDGVCFIQWGFVCCGSVFRLEFVKGIVPYSFYASTKRVMSI